jgi:hypothetical protein
VLKVSYFRSSAGRIPFGPSWVPRPGPPWCLFRCPCRGRSLVPVVGCLGGGSGPASRPSPGPGRGWGGSLGVGSIGGGARLGSVGGRRPPSAYSARRPSGSWWGVQAWSLRGSRPGFLSVRPVAVPPPPLLRLRFPRFCRVYPLPVFRLSFSLFWEAGLPLFAIPVPRVAGSCPKM